MLQKLGLLTIDTILLGDNPCTSGDAAPWRSLPGRPDGANLDLAWNLKWSEHWSERALWTLMASEPSLL